MSPGAALLFRVYFSVLKRVPFKGVIPDLPILPSLNEFLLFSHIPMLIIQKLVLVAFRGYYGILYVRGHSKSVFLRVIVLIPSGKRILLCFYIFSLSFIII